MLDFSTFGDPGIEKLLSSNPGISRDPGIELFTPLAHLKIAILLYFLSKLYTNVATKLLISILGLILTKTKL